MIEIAGAVGAMVGQEAARVTIREGVEVVADLLEGIGRMQAAVGMLQRDIATAQAAGLSDIPKSTVDAARAYAISRGDALAAKLEAAEARGE